MNVIDQALQHVAHQLAAASRIWVAYSGGVDSHVLLHALVRYSKQNLRVVHVHHGLQAVADRWVDHCTMEAAKLGVPIDIIKVNAHPALGQSPEQAARQARYEAIKSLLQPGDMVLTAHNQDDQAETLILQLLRGAGPKGLAAMPLLTTFGVGQMARPLLNISRADIEAHARVAELKWVEDPTNLVSHYDRNYLRNEIIPLLKQRWPSVNTVLTRSARHQAQTAELLDNLAELDHIALQGSVSNTLSVSAVLMLSQPRQRNVLRHWIHLQNLPRPTSQQLDVLLKDVLQAEPDKNPLLSWTGAEVRRYRDNLYAMLPLLHFDSSTVIHWHRHAPLILPSNLGVIEVEHSSLPAYPQPVIIRFRQGKERLKMPHRQGSHSLKHLMQEWALPPWLRERVPLIYVEDTLVSVYGYSDALS